ncbi:phage integrase N-terminal SAM-like domain-containing protein [Thalassolituus marinus]|uniref:Phage integrase N-terminal SAM-like domain-containing protein n=2 Tax=Thalassolituus marinus TaxID=671053 RepID=A0ABS7ZLV0_9GAMM|nr:phage integrase N-terminal SAM-like domain-containing protein [Thalassolituus marinus]
MSLRTEKTYIYWIRSFSHYNNHRRPRDMGSDEVMRYWFRRGRSGR